MLLLPPYISSVEAGSPWGPQQVSIYSTRALLGGGWEGDHFLGFWENGQAAHPASDCTCGRDQAHRGIYLSLTQVDSAPPTTETLAPTICKIVHQERKRPWWSEQGSAVFIRIVPCGRLRALLLDFLTMLEGLDKPENEWQTCLDIPLAEPIFDAKAEWLAPEQMSLRLLGVDRAAEQLVFSPRSQEPVIHGFLWGVQNAKPKVGVSSTESKKRSEGNLIKLFWCWFVLCGKVWH